MGHDIDKLLKEELEIYKGYELEAIEDIPREWNAKLIKLNKENVKKVETMLRYNSSYEQFNPEEQLSEDIYNELKRELNKIKSDGKNKDKQYKFTSTHYIKAFKYLYLDNCNDKERRMDADNYYETLIYIILRKVNSENRTRVSLAEIDKIAEAICKEYKKINVNSFIKALKEPVDKTNHFEREYKLIEIISKNYKDDAEKERHNFSLATKFCHFVSFYLFDEGKYRDAYSIYDQVVKDNLKYYYDYYVKDNKIEKYPFDASNADNEKALVKIYQNYQFIIDKILDNINHEISRNGFDHIVWYTNKGR